MQFDYFKFRQLPISKVDKFVKIAEEIHKHKAENSTAGLLAMMLTGKKPS